MEFKKLVPWNWFKKEEETGTAVPVHNSSQENHFGNNEPVGHLHREVDLLFDNFFSGFRVSPARLPLLIPFGTRGFFSDSFTGRFLKPTLDIESDDKEYSISIETPGVDQKDIKLEITNNTLTVSGEKKQEHEEKEKNYYRMERSYGFFQRVLSLPEDANQEKIKATFKNGVLSVTMPRKSLPVTNLKQISIN